MRKAHDVYEDQDVHEETYKEIQLIRFSINGIEDSWKTIRHCSIFATGVYVLFEIFTRIFGS